MQTAYQRWELASLLEEGSQRKKSAAKTEPDPVATAKLAQEMLAAREAGRQAGYQQGLQEGRATGLREGHAQGLNEGRVEVAARCETVDQLGQRLEQQIRQAREEIAQQLLTLALQMAKAMLKSALKVQPALLLPAIDEALHSLPLLQLPATLLLHPQDLELLESMRGTGLKAAGWRLRADSSMERGDCRIETGTNVIDATLATRWRRLQQTLGRDDEWLMPETD
jgi:flagellar assembly protein FliH